MLGVRNKQKKFNLTSVSSPKEARTKRYNWTAPDSHPALLDQIMMTSRIIATSLASTVTLNDGVVMPMFGLGTYKLSQGVGGEAEGVTSFALRHGYRLLDGAAFYGNEEDVGRGIKASGVPRDQIFVVSKLCWTDHGYEECKKGFHESLAKFDCGYLDLYLIHSPSGGKILKTYDAMQELKKAGLIRSVGVSNFNIEQLEGLRLAGRPTPSTNQVELHPMNQETELVKYCREKGITLMGYSPLAKARRMDEKMLNSMATRYGKSLAQLMIRWSVQNGFITIPKSSREERVIENTKVFDWSVTQADMLQISNIQNFKCVQTDNKPWDQLA